MLIYTIVVRATEDNDVQAWAAHNVDLELLEIRSIEDSAFSQHKILRLETDRLDDNYCRWAFEGSLNQQQKVIRIDWLLNHEINDPLSDVIWWNKSEKARGELSARDRAAAEIAERTSPPPPDPRLVDTL